MISTGQPYRRAVAVAVVFVVTAGMLLGVGTSPAVADVSAVQGSAYGCYANTTFSMAEDPGPPTETGPLPELTLPPEGGSDTATEPECVHRAFPTGGPTIISTGPLTVTTEGITGPAGSVTSTATLGPVNTDGNEHFSATSVSSECTADESGVTGSTTIVGGVVETNQERTDVVTVPPDPEPGYTVTVDVGFASWRYIFNEQIENGDGSITVNAVRMETLTGPLQGPAILGQVVCGVTADTTTTTTTVPGATTTTVQGATTTTVPGTTPTTTTPPPTTTVPPATPVTTIPPTPTTTPGEDDDPPTGAGATEVGGGAFGYFADVSLFGGPSEERGPEPLVRLAADAANSPQNASVNSAQAVYGPAVLFRSGRIDVRTEGALGAEGYVTSSSSVQGAPDVEQRPGPLLYDALESTCTVDGDSVVGSTTVTGGVVETRTDPNTQLPVDTEAIPANPAPGYTVEGTIDHVGDRFRIVFNEQITNADGSITVNAAHMHLLGPIAVGELIIGQSECAWGSAAAGNAGGGAGGSGTGRGAGTGAGTDGRLARSGSDPLPAAALGFGLLLAGMFALQGGRRGRVVDGRLR